MFKDSGSADITGQSSLLDEVFEALHVASDADTTMAFDSASFTSFPADYTDTARLIGNGHHSSTSTPIASNNSSFVFFFAICNNLCVYTVLFRLKSRPEAHVRPMSQGEAKKWCALSEKAHKKADKKLDEAHEMERETMIALGIIEPPAPIRSNSLKNRVVGCDSIVFGQVE
jgi:hypothetical protein